MALRAEELLALIVFTVLGTMAGIVLPLIGSAYNWRQWLKLKGSQLSHRQQHYQQQSNGYDMPYGRGFSILPFGFGAYIFAFFYTGAAVLFSIAAWLVWSERWESENGIVNTAGTVDQVWFEVSMYLVLGGLLLWALTPLTFFIAGMDLRSPGLAIFSQFLVLGAVVTATVFFWMIWWLPGLLGTLASVFALYALYVVWHFYSLDEVVWVSFSDELYMRAYPTQQSQQGEQYYVAPSLPVNPNYS